MPLLRKTESSKGVALICATPLLFEIDNTCETCSSEWAAIHARRKRLLPCGTVGGRMAGM